MATTAEQLDIIELEAAAAPLPARTRILAAVDKLREATSEDVFLIVPPPRRRYDVL